jgi:AAA15 family ATPase/GTPase
LKPKVETLVSKAKWAKVLNSQLYFHHRKKTSVILKGLFKRLMQVWNNQVFKTTHSEGRIKLENPVRQNK